MIDHVADDPGLPFGAAVRAEFTRIRTHPGDTVAVVALNGVMMTVIWFLLPRSWFFTFTGPSGYALALAGWMYSDVTASNILAADPDRVLELIGDPASLRTVLRAKEAVLWMLVAPLCMVVAIACGVAEQDWQYTALVVIAVAVVPIGALAVTGLVGVFFPYHQQPLLWRWRQRRRFGPVVLRWSILTIAPYLVYPAVACAIMAVPLALWWLVDGIDRTQRLPTAASAVCLVVTAALSALCWVWANRYAIAWIERHSVALREYLSDRERG
ncbi:hypothetical protein ACPXB3_06130 [Gordonia sp. DT219]|uniref:hypothetical protein n=1 Tax=Gordonia sp. DT219 TaxID=3416658 RepID=UPI003CF0F71A